MPKPVKGFMTDNGNFFEHEDEAEFHEAETDLIDKLRDAGVDPERFLPLAVRFNSEIRRYVNAYLEINTVEIESVKLDKPSVDDELARLLSDTPSGPTPDDGSREEVDAPVQSQSDDGRGAVSDVGSSPRPETVRERKKGDGS